MLKVASTRKLSLTNECYLYFDALLLSTLMSCDVLITVAKTLSSTIPLFAPSRYKKASQPTPDAMQNSNSVHAYLDHMAHAKKEHQQVSGSALRRGCDKCHPGLHKFIL